MIRKRPNKLLASFFIIVMLAAFVLAAPSFSTFQTTSYLLEDQTTLFTYNFTANVTNPENDTLTFSIVEINSDSHVPTNASAYPWIELNASTGVLSINSTLDNETGVFNISVQVLNTVPVGQTEIFYFDVNATNDAPNFLNLANQTLNKSLYELILLAEDEEGDTPFVFNVSFVSCIHNAINPPTGPGNCTLFSLSDFNDTATNITITPNNSMKGEYIINFTVRDNGNTTTPYNSSRSQIVNWTLEWNDDPYFTYVCDSTSSATEDSELSCYINASDPDEIRNITFESNYTWFTFNYTGTDFSSINTTGGNASELVNFTANDPQVGNWTINITITDTGTPAAVNSTIYYLYIANVNDSLGIHDIDNFTAYTSNNYTLYVNASDNDLLIPDTNVYDEELTFTSNTSWVSVTGTSELSGLNITQATLEFDPNDGGAGNHTINITVTDSNNFSIDSYLFSIEVISNGPPQWISGVESNFTLTENIEFYLNLSQNVSDPQGDSLTFTYSNVTSFDSFSFNLTTGIINFTPIDVDVGEHILEINVTDGVTPTPLTFNLTVSNVNDAPVFETPLTGTNLTISSNSNMNVTEDNYTIISMFNQDEDFKIPSGQKEFYNETLSVDISIVGPNTNLFSFVRDSSFPTTSGISINRSLFTATFTPNKSDVGDYNITLNVSDASNSSVILTFNLTVNEINHYPNITETANTTSGINQTLYLDINATDVEEQNESSYNMTFNLSFLNDGSSDTFYFGDESIFNSTTGVLNLTFNDSQDGRYHVNISVNDTGGFVDSDDFWIFVYGVPNITSPSSSFVFNLVEGNQSSLNFTVNDSVGDNVTYNFYLNSTLRYNVSYYANATNITWLFTPNYSDETYGAYDSLNLTIINPYFSDLNYTLSWNVNITHSNAPVNFTSDIPAQSGAAGSNITLNLTSYFSDVDFFDPVYNQTLNFSVLSNESTNSTINVTINTSLLTITFFSSSVDIEEFNITAYDLNSSSDIQTNDTSNLFNVSFTSATSTSSSSSSGGGGGGGGSSQAQSNVLEVEVPDPISVAIGETVNAPITLTNLDSAALTDIGVNYAVTRDDGTPVTAWAITLSNSLFSEIAADDDVEFILTAQPLLLEEGSYQIEISASNTDGSIEDSDVLYINVLGDLETELLLDLVQEVVDQNIDCLEVQEYINAAQVEIDAGNLEVAEELLYQAWDGCIALSTGDSLDLAPPRENFFTSGRIGLTISALVILSVVLFIAFIGYDLFVRLRFRRMMNDYDVEAETKYFSSNS